MRSTLLAILAFAACTSAALAQDAVPAPSAPPLPIRDAGLPNPYHLQNDWMKLPPGRPKLGGVADLNMDRDGKTVWVFERCGNTDDGCAINKTIDPVMHFDANGNLLKSFGAGLFVDPHGIYVDKNDNIWLVDSISKSHLVGDTVREFSPEGKLLLTLGTEGTKGDGPYQFNGVSDVLVAPDGSIFVADGHDPGSNSRVVKYDRNGKFLMQFGQRGAGPTDFNPPHGLAMDNEGRLYVADRGNHAVKIFDQEGHLLQVWPQFGMPSGVFIDKADNLYVSDSLSSDKSNPGFAPGIRIGNVHDGKVVAYIPWPEFNTIEGITVADDGTIYSGFTNIPGEHRFLKN